MPEIKVKIPDGDYCNGCPFLADETKPIIDIMGNLKGIEEHHICLRNNHSILEEEMTPITPCGLFQDTKIKKKRSILQNGRRSFKSIFTSSTRNSTTAKRR